MANQNPNTDLLLRSQLKQLRLPTMLAEYAKLARDAAAGDQSYEDYLLSLADAEVVVRQSNALSSRIKQAGFPTHKDLDTFDFTAIPSLPKPKVLELVRGEWIGQHENVCLLGGNGTGKTHVALALGLAACRQGYRVRFFVVAHLVGLLEKAQKQYQLDRLLAQLDRVDLLVLDELGYLSFSRSAAELLFQIFADRYERRSMLVTTNLPFSEWGQIFTGERMTAALLDRFTHRCQILELEGESYRFRESMKRKGKARSR